MGECILARRGGGKSTLEPIAIDFPFEYSGNTILTVEYDGVANNWAAQLIESGTTLTFKQDTTLEVCLVGGGAGGSDNGTVYGVNGGGHGGGGGGMTIATYNFKANTQYTITIGAGGSANGDGGTTSISGTNLSASGGKKDRTGGVGASKTGGAGGVGATAGSDSTAGSPGNDLFGDASYGILLGAGGGGGGFRNDNTLDNANRGIGSNGGLGGGGKGGNASGSEAPYSGWAGSNAAVNTGSGGGGSGTGQTNNEGASHSSGHGSGAAGAIFIRNVR